MQNNSRADELGQSYLLQLKIQNEKLKIIFRSEGDFFYKIFAVC